MPSKIWSISTELKRSVPLKSRCSRKCEIPACSGASLREPTPIQNPSAIDRTEGMASVTTRTPEPSSVSLCPSAANRRLLPPVARVPGGAGPAAAALAAVTPAAVASVASVAAAALAPAASAWPVAALAARRVDEHRPVVLHVDLRVELLGQGADRLAALADDHADLLGIDLDRGDPRRVGRQLRTGLGDDLVHLAEDERPPLLRLCECIAQDVKGDARDLHVHLELVDAAIR